MYYVPTDTGAFDSLQHIMRNVKFGWLLRYMHSTGGSAFFVIIYFHMYRCLMYGSYKFPRELLWLFGMMIFVLLLAEAYTGYVLPWGQMSFWGTKVIISLFTAIPWVGKYIAIWLQGDYNVSGITLHRFFTFHVAVFPMTIVGLVFLHLIALRTSGSLNPDGIEIKEHLDEKGVPIDGIPFHPYYTVKDLLGIVVFLLITCAIIFFKPGMHGYFLETENFLPANALHTPDYIRPLWYMAPFYAILRAIPHKLMGIIAMGSSIAVLFVLPWLDRSPVKSMHYRGIYSRMALLIFTISFIGLGFLGTQPPTPNYVYLTRILSVLYFSFFLLMPIYTRYEHTKPVPKRTVTTRTRRKK